VVSIYAYYSYEHGTKVFIIMISLHLKMQLEQTPKMSCSLYKLCCNELTVANSFRDLLQMAYISCYAN